MADPPINPLSIGFPQIDQRWSDERGVVNQLWLQLLIALWNRTGSAPGGSIIDIQVLLAGLDGEAGSVADIDSALDAAGLALSEALPQLIDESLARYFLLHPPEVPTEDWLKASLLGGDASDDSSADECGCCTPVEAFGAGGAISLAAQPCGTIFTNTVA